MHIAQMLDTLYWGGAQKMQLFLIESLRPLGIEVTVIDLSDSSDSSIPSALRAAGAGVVSFPFDNLFSPGSFLRLVDFMRDQRFDLLHTYLTYSNIVGSLAGRLTGTPVIASLRSAGFDLKDYSARRSTLETLALRHAAHCVMANGEAVAEFARLRLGAASDIRVVPNAVDIQPALSREERQAVRAGLLLDDDAALIISVGRLVEDKGFSDLITAFVRVHDRHQAAFLAIAGEGDLRPQLEAQVNNLGLQKNVALLGQRDDARRLMAAADIYVNASLREGTPVSVLEAMAAGLPIAATQVGEIPFLLPPGAGLLSPAGQPPALAAILNLLLDSAELRARLGAAALARVQTHYSRAAWRQNLLELYAQVTPKAREYL